MVPILRHDMFKAGRLKTTLILLHHIVLHCIIILYLYTGLCNLFVCLLVCSSECGCANGTVVELSRAKLRESQGEY